MVKVNQPCCLILLGSRCIFLQLQTTWLSVVVITTYEPYNNMCKMSHTSCERTLWNSGINQNIAHIQTEVNSFVRQKLTLPKSVPFSIILHGMSSSLYIFLSLKRFGIFFLYKKNRFMGSWFGGEQSESAFWQYGASLVSWGTVSV